MLLVACSNDDTGAAETSQTSSSSVGTGSSSSGTDVTSGNETTATSVSTDSGTTGGSIGDTGVIFDVGNQTTGDTETGGIQPSCKVGDEMDAPQPCIDVAPPDSFEPDVQWAWSGENGEDQVLVTPIVGNLTDDNDDGEIDLCDIPDVVTVAYQSASFIGTVGHIYVLDGETGVSHFRIDQGVHSIVYPAIGDIDDDGIPEIVSVTSDDLGSGNLVAFEHDGTVAWQGTDTLSGSSNAISLADLDADGDVEIIFQAKVFDHLGTLLWTGTGGYLNTAADLDGDDDLEVIFGGNAYHHDGSPYFSGGDPNGHPHVADLDLDGLPEVMVVSNAGITIIEHDGTVTTTNAASGLASWRPAAVHDMDGDDAPEIAVGSSNSYSVLEANLAAVWTANVLDSSGYAAGTAFDFLGDGSAEAMYADETTLFIFDGTGTPLLTTSRESWTQWENPVVADVDNDGSAEIVVVSNRGYTMGTTPPVQVIRDAEDRWIPARRIWNQHAYHVTNVREDGTIPAMQPKNWETLNTFRTQAQIEAGGGVCIPEPEG